jgi:CubicO group peptidase (beta-lactamase class C family)
MILPLRKVLGPSFVLLIIGVTWPMQAAIAQLSSKSDPRVINPDTVLARLPVGDKNADVDFTLRQLMDSFYVPGLSVAVIDDYKIVWAKGYGVTEPGGNTPITTKTLFQAGSISKPVAAAGALWLVERGKLSLDEDVNKELKTWKVPENEFTKTQKVTLRRLMSHSAGLTVHGFPGYAAGEPVPTLVQIFNGEKPANTAPIRVDFVPGSQFRYSGGGVTIEQQLIVDVTGEPFPKFMHDTVLSKAGMTDSTYEQPLPARLAPLAAAGTRSAGTTVKGRYHTYPEMAAAGLWTTPTDLAKFAIEIALSKHGKANHILSEKMTREMLTPQVKAGDDFVGLGPFIDGKEPDRFGHDGADEGFQALLTISGDTGKGVAVMGNSDAFFHVAPYVVEAVAKAYGWKPRPAPHDTNGLLQLAMNTKGLPAALDLYSHMKDGSVAGYKVDENTLIPVGYDLLRAQKVDDAIKVFELDVHDYPNYWNAYDSLAEAYATAGKKDLAIQNYEKSVELNHENQSGIEALKKLRGETPSTH